MQVASISSGKGTALVTVNESNRASEGGVRRVCRRRKNSGKSFK